MSNYPELPINSIKVVSNYRKTFFDKSLNELAESIRVNGVLQPVLVRHDNGEYQLIAGERRIRAATMAGLVTIPAIIKENVSDEEFYKFQIIENIQREGVQYMEEACGLQRLRDNCDMDVSEMAKKLGKSDALIYNLLSLNKMSPIALEAANNNELTKTVAVRIARLPNHLMQDQAAAALRRKHKDKLVTDRFARKYFQDNFKERKVVRHVRRNRIQKENGNDYAANWKKYLVNFSSRQFEYWKTIVNGRTETTILSEAVEKVMMGVMAEQ